LLQTKGEVAFDWTVTERSKFFFCLIRPRNLAQFAALCLSFSAYRRQRVANAPTPRGAKPGWKFAAHQLVIVPCRWPKARALSVVEGERQSRESNDPEKAKPDPFGWLLIAER
jgi:hypothetical protein